MRQAPEFSLPAAGMHEARPVDARRGERTPCTGQARKWFPCGLERSEPKQSPPRTGTVVAAWRLARHRPLRAAILPGIMATKPRVAVLRVTPETILDDIDRLLDLAGVRQAMDPSATTILKDNISWHFPFPAANTTPWQLEGTILALRKAGFADLAAVQNKTVVTNAFKGEDLNHYVPIFRRHGVPVLYNFRDEDMQWIEYKPKAKMLVLDKIYPEGIRIPDYFVGKNIMHLPTTKCVAGDTEIILGDGTRATIRDLFQRAAAAGGAIEVDGDLRCRTQVSVLAMDAEGRFRPFRASWLWRTQRQDRRVLALRTCSGRAVVATEDHPLWTPTGWRRLGCLAKGEGVAIGGHSGVQGASQPLPNTAIQSSPRRAPGLAVALSRPDLAWDSVAEVREIDGSQIDLYDLTVPEAESFVGNGLILHNCHIYTTTTGAMKNAFGGLLNTKRHYTHSWIHATLVDLLAIQKEIHPGIFAVVDGTTAGNGPGPRTMFPVVKNFMLASADQVAVDAVSAKMMGFDPMSIDYIRLGHEAGLGVGRPAEIEVVGADVSQENWGFRVGDNGASRVGDLLWFGPLRGVQNLFFRTPLVNLFILGSEAYHDFYRWPARDRRVFERWLRETSWGQLFAAYARGDTATVTAARATGSAERGRSS